MNRNTRGQLQNGQFHGNGALTASDGAKYVGKFQNGQLHGMGTLTYRNGTMFVGEWKNDSMQNVQLTASPS